MHHHVKINPPQPLFHALQHFVHAPPTPYPQYNMPFQQQQHPPPQYSVPPQTNTPVLYQQHDQQPHYRADRFQQRGHGGCGRFQSTQPYCAPVFPTMQQNMFPHRQTQRFQHVNLPYSNPYKCCCVKTPPKYTTLTTLPCFPY